MRRSNVQSLGSVIKEFLQERQLDRKMAEIDAVNLWETILGKTIANATKSVSIKNGTLYVELKSSIVRHQLSMMRSDIQKAMNEQVGYDVVHEVVLR